MSCTADTIELLHRAGLRATNGRAAVVTALRHAGGHRSVEDLIEWIDGEPGRHVALSVSTIYRTLDALEVCGLVGAVRRQGMPTTFEWMGAQESHAHLLCERCGLEEMLPVAVQRRIEASITRSTAFQPWLGHLTIRGECASCAARRLPPA
ncbi:MAG: transcriptional repressor [Dehalococcoidia bacterium]|nr:transcriptional repressor [Dehalococcoidia bacterium]